MDVAEGLFHLLPALNVLSPSADWQCEGCECERLWEALSDDAGVFGLAVVSTALLNGCGKRSQLSAAVVSTLMMLWRNIRVLLLVGALTGSAPLVGALSDWPVCYTGLC